MALFPIDSAQFPSTYRQLEIQRLACWINAGQSGSVIGLPGCGRSNLLEFLCSHPALCRTATSADFPAMALIPINLYTLPALDMTTFYRGMLRAFYHAAPTFIPDLQVATARFYREHIAAQDPFLPQSALYELLLLFQQSQTRVVLVLNHLDDFLLEASPKITDTLRGLRDTFRHTLCIIAGMSQEVAYLPRPELVGELYELLDRNVCWVGVMTDADAEALLLRATATASSPPTTAEICAMSRLAGNFPVLLHSIAQWWGNLPAMLPVNQWAAALSVENNVVYRLRKMWNGLTQEEQFVLAELHAIQSRFPPARKPHQESHAARQTLQQRHYPLLTRMAQKGVCCQREGQWKIQGELFAAYVQEMGTVSRGRIWLEPETQTIYQGLTPVKDLTPLENRLLVYLIKHPYRPHEKDDLIAYLWEEQESAMVDNDLQQLIYRLRKKVDTMPPYYILTWKGRPGGYQFYPEGRPL